MTRPRPVVAIDGPAGAGKSTVSKNVAARLGYVLVDTGALYRTVALAARRDGISWDAHHEVGVLAAGLADRNAVRLVPDAERGVRVLLDGEDVSSAIRTQEIGEGASRVSAIGAVRTALLELQRGAGRAGGVVLEGRDIGTVVFPDAEAKFFLTASVAVRARRRFDELVARGEAPILAEIEREVRERDERDSSRAIAPLVQAPDAELLDSSDASIAEVTDRIVHRVRAIAASAPVGK